MGRLKFLIDIKLFLNEHQWPPLSIWYHSEALEVPYYPKQYLGRDFFATSYSKAALATILKALYT